MLKNIKGRHWVFIVGFISAVIASRWSLVVSGNIIDLLILIGVGILVRDGKERIV